MTRAVADSGKAPARAGHESPPGSQVTAGAGVKVVRSGLARSSVTAMLAGIAAGCAPPRTIPEVEPAPEPIVRRAADYVLGDFPDPPPFNWGEGVLMAGMMQAGAVTGDERYVDFVRRWADHWCEEGLGPVLEARGYCGHWGPGLPVLMLYEQTQDDRYLAMARQIVDFMQGPATRTADGGLGHWRDNRQLWVDTLFMSCPVYANLGRLAAEPALIDEAAKQLEVSADHLQDAGTGLFYHMYDETTATRTEEVWARGNGWTAMAYMSVLRYLDPSSPAYRERVTEFRRLAAGVITSQNYRTGLWHTVLDRPDSYLETSASAMLLYSLLEARKLGVIRLPEERLVQRAWTGLLMKIDDEGRVFDVSGGTGPGTFEQYAKIPRGTYPWGTGACLLAACALCGGW